VENCSEYSDLLSKLGFTCKLKFPSLEELEFCSSIVLPFGNGWALVPKPGKLLAKTFWCKNTNFREEERKTQFAGILNGLTILRFIPGIRGLYFNDVYLERFSAPDSLSWRDRTYGEHLNNELVLTETTYHALAERYGISVAELLSLEAFLQTAPYPINLEGQAAAEEMINVDWSAPSDGVESSLVSLVFHAAIEEGLRWMFPVPVSLTLGLVESVAHRNPVSLFGHILLFLCLREYGVLTALVVHVLWNYSARCTADAFIMVNTKKNRPKGRKGAKAPKTSKRKSKNRSSKDSGTVKKALMLLGSLGGGALGGMMGQPALGAELGSMGGAMVSHISGHGDYDVSGLNKNSLVLGGTVPTFSNGENFVRIRNREYIRDIPTRTAFTMNLTSPINPGQVSLFPWLAGVAQNYQEYAFEGLVFEYVSTSGDALNSTNAALGSIMMATQYDVLQPAFTSQVQMNNNEYSCVQSPSVSFIHAVECAPKERPMDIQYIRTGKVPTGADARMYDLGNFSCAGTGSQAGYTGGQLWVSYDVKLYKPSYVAGGLAVNKWLHISNASPTNTEILGPIQRNANGNLIHTVSVTGTGYDTLNFDSTQIREGEYYLFFGVWKGSSTASLALTVTPTGFSVVNSQGIGTGGAISNSGSTTDKFMYMAIWVANATTPRKIVFSAATLPTSGTYVDWYMTPFYAENFSSLDSPTYLFDEFKKYMASLTHDSIGPKLIEPPLVEEETKEDDWNCVCAHHAGPARGLGAPLSGTSSLT
jgi:hypothetical protein